MDSHLRGQVVVVTGASGGIGSAIARKFAAEGARLVLQYHRGRTRIGELQKELCATDPLIVQADLTSENETKRLFGRSVKRFGRVDTLIANAGSWESREVPLDQMPLRQWQRTLESVLTTTFLKCTRIPAARSQTKARQCGADCFNRSGLW